MTGEKGKTGERELKWEMRECRQRSADRGSGAPGEGYLAYATASFYRRSLPAISAAPPIKPEKPTSLRSTRSCESCGRRAEATHAARSVSGRIELLGNVPRGTSASRRDHPLRQPANYRGINRRRRDESMGQLRRGRFRRSAKLIRALRPNRWCHRSARFPLASLAAHIFPRRMRGVSYRLPEDPLGERDFAQCFGVLLNGSSRRDDGSFNGDWRIKWKMAQHLSFQSVEFYNCRNCFVLLGEENYKRELRILINLDSEIEVPEE